ncbi:ARM repeat-containing protein [Rozella allomycis CSF55]|uniref:Importin subunit alpha n=1 Tax=Rozella allomycis (strain CSF55) TaxID=988480 RepID=A0A4P9YF38_ROZAC|nr:ARM repeat-containing protein [Rozella allomycis CSF55]
MASQRTRLSFKNNALTKDEMRRRRDQHKIELSKNHRELQQQKKRIQSEEMFEKMKLEEIKVKVPLIVKGMEQSDLQVKLNSIIEMRRLLLDDVKEISDIAISAGVLKICADMIVPIKYDQIEQINCDAIREIQYEAMHLINIISSGTTAHTNAVILSGCVPDIIQHFCSGVSEMMMKAIWALGNIASDTDECRSYLFECGILDPILSYISLAHKNPSSCDESMLNSCVWTLTNLCRKESVGETTRARFSDQIFSGVNMLLDFPDPDIQSDACWALDYLTENTNVFVELVVNAGIIRKLIQILDTANDDSYLRPALRVIGNVAFGLDSHANEIINSGFLKTSFRLLQHPSRNLIRETCWVISNLAAGNPEQIQAIINSSIIPLMIQTANRFDYKVKAQVCQVIANATSQKYKYPDQTKYLVIQGSIKHLCDTLRIADAELVQILLEALENILEVGEHFKQINESSTNVYKTEIEEIGGLQTIEQLLNHDKNEISFKCQEIICNYFNEDDDLDLNVENQGQMIFDFEPNSIKVPQNGFAF